MAAKMCEQEARSLCDNQEWGGKEGEGGAQRWFQGRNMAFNTLWSAFVHPLTRILLNSLLAKLDFFFLMPTASQ